MFNDIREDVFDELKSFVDFGPLEGNCHSNFLFEMLLVVDVNCGQDDIHEDVQVDCEESHKEQGEYPVLVISWHPYKLINEYIKQIS